MRKFAGIICLAALAMVTALTTSARPPTLRDKLAEDLRKAIDESNLADIESLLGQDSQLANVAPDRAGGKPSSTDGYPPLHYAIGMGAKQEVIKLLLEKGASPNVKCPDGTAMHLAVVWASADVIKLLLAKGGDVNGASSAPAVTPLHVALLHRPTKEQDIARLFVEKGAKIDVFSAAGLGQIDVLKKFLKDDPKAATEPNEAGLFPLHYAAARGQIEAAKLLLENKANPDATTKPSETAHPSTDASMTPLAWAVGTGQAEMVTLLIAHKADIEAANNRDQTPIFDAQDAKMIDLLVKAGAKVDHVDDWGDSPLIRVVRWGDSARAQALLNAKADPNMPQGPCKVVMPSMSVDAFRPPANPDGKTTPLHVAAQYGNAEIIPILIKAGAKIDVQDTAGRTPLDVAVKNEHKDAAKALKDAGGKESPKKPDAPASEDEEVGTWSDPA